MLLKAWEVIGAAVVPGLLLKGPWMMQLCQHEGCLQLWLV